MVAPALMPIELTNILRQRMRRQPPMSLMEARARLAQFLAMPINLATPSGLYDRALELAANHNLPSAYDALYVALAEHLGCELWTADERLINNLRGRLGFVKGIASYTPGDPL
jgi:predicted nucleic acid-binding protein